MELKDRRNKALSDFKPDDFPMCGHPELIPTYWEEPKPVPARMIGSCPQHNAICPVCGFGWASYPSCNC